MSPDNQELLKFLSSLGVGGVIAGVLFFFYRKDVKQFTELWQGQAKLNYLQTEAMLQVVKENTAAFTQNTEVTKSLHKRLDGIERHYRQADDEASPERQQRRQR